MKIRRIYGVLFTSVVFTAVACSPKTDVSASVKKDSTAEVQSENSELVINRNPIDTADYNRRMKMLANGDTTGKWPAKMVYPLPGAIFPYHRVVAYYGNLYSKKMGVLGEYPRDEMLAKLKVEVKKWHDADTSLPVIPALHYIAVTAQSNGGKQRLRMPFKQIDTILNWAKQINGLTFLDVQVGWSTLQEEIPELDKYLAMPTVHLGIDPEFSMKFGDVPGKRIGTYNSDDINFVIDHLADIVRKNNLPPKVLVVHRFTQGMVTNVANIKNVPEVQVVMDMDGWGDRILKKSSYLLYIYKEPVQFAGFKLFYKNDIKNGDHVMYTPQELNKFIPKPVYIQYQ
ncbi:lipoprotein [soil metagenome]